MRPFSVIFKHRVENRSRIVIQNKTKNISFDDILDVSEDGDPPDEVEAPDNACIDEDVEGEKKNRLSETIAKLQKVKETLSLLKSRHSKASPPRSSTEIVEEVVEVNPDKSHNPVGSIDTAENSVEERGASDTEEEFEAKSDIITFTFPLIAASCCTDPIMPAMSICCSTKVYRDPCNCHNFLNKCFKVG